MAAMLETPSRIWRRIEAIENRDMPSLPSLPPFEDSEDAGLESSDALSQSDQEFGTAVHSTPGPVSTVGRKLSLDRFEISRISSVPKVHTHAGHHSDETDSEVEDPQHGYTPAPGDGYEDEDVDLSISDALQPISRSSSPAHAYGKERAPMKSYDYSVSLKSEPKPSPIQKFRNVSLRRPPSRTRTPSLTHTLTSTSSSSTNDTPPPSAHVSRSSAISPIPGASIPLPESRLASESPGTLRRRTRDDASIIEDEQRSISQSMQMQSMDMTDIQISPPQLGYTMDQDGASEAQSETDEGRHQFTDTTDEKYEGFESQEDEVNEATSAEEPEPTFSSEAEQTAYGPRVTFGQVARHSPASGAPSSPAQSLPFTPTPAFPRPRSRFSTRGDIDDLETPRPPANPYPRTESADEENSEEQSDDAGETVYEPHQKQVRVLDDDLITPHSRRRSFLLSVINSTARPRLKYSTPHPRNAMATEYSVSAANTTATPATNIRTTFAGFTPRPRLPSRGGSGSSGQTSSQSASLASEISPASQPSSGSATRFGSARVQLVTPGPSGSISPHVQTDNASFISTASSHDLTTHHRVNTSFDPAMGFGTGIPGQGVGRFNAGKLNTYLHGLNRRLQEENEILMDRLRRLQDEKEGLADKKIQENLSIAFSSASRRSSAARRASGGTVLDDVREDVVAEGWLEEKAELEELVESYKDEAARASEEKEQLERKLEVEREDRERDKQRWKDRMTELEQGVEEVVKDLEQKLEQSEDKARLAEEKQDRQMKDILRRLSDVQDEHAIALDRAERAERALESEKELGGELRESGERLTKVMADLRSANSHIQELEEEATQADSRIEALEKALRVERDATKGLVEELDKKANILSKEKDGTRRADAEKRQAREEVESMRGYIAELEDQLGVVTSQVASVEHDLAVARQESETALSDKEEADRRIQRLEAGIQKAQDIAQHLEDVLQETEEKVVHDQGVIAELNARVNSLERELEREKERPVDPSRDILVPSEADVHALEEELDAANKEIARLNTLLNQSPARKAVDKAKDMRIEVLEREKEELLERNRALRMTVTEMNTPSKVINGSGISPIHRHVLSMSIRAPRTPGGPLKELSWLNAPSDPSVSPLVAEISRLQRELDRANESIDDKLDKLQDAGLGVVGLTGNLEDARAKIIALEDEISRLSRKEVRLVHRMERIRCQKCHVKVDVRGVVHADESSVGTFKDNLLAESEAPTRTSEALRVELRSVNFQLENLKKQWEDEKCQLVGEKEALRDTAERLDVQVKRAQEEVRRVVESGRAGDKARASIEGELESAKRVIADLEDKLRVERANLRALTTEQDRLQRSKAEVLSQLQRTEADMEDVRRQLLKIKQENHDLEKELRMNATAEQKARILEGRVTENLETIEQLRHERSLLAADHKQLQRRFTELTEQASQLRSKYSASSTSHEKRRNQLDLHRLEIEELRNAVSEQVDELHRTEKEKNRIAAEKEDVARTVASLEADLRRVKKNAEAFGRDLKRLRAEKENMEESHKHELARLESSKKKAQAQIRHLNEQLENHTDAAQRAREELKRHSCTDDDTQLAALRLQHNKECKGLIVQIRYLKAKFTRESSLRTNLCYQKQYLLVLLARHEQSEKTIFASIARIGLSVSPPSAQKKLWTLRSVAAAVLFSVRAKRAAQAWREEGRAKEAIAIALHEVRQRRAARPMDLSVQR